MTSLKEAARSVAAKEMTSPDKRQTEQVDDGDDNVGGGDADGSADDGAEGTAPPKKAARAESPRVDTQAIDKAIRARRGMTSKVDGQDPTKIASLEKVHGKTEYSKGGR